MNLDKKSSSPTAIHLVSEAEKIDPIAFFHWSNGSIYESAGMYYQASESYRQALRVYPDSYEIRITLAEVLFRIQHFEDALAVLQPISPETAEVWNLRASALRATGADDSARICYRKVVELNPKNTAAFSFLASDYRRLGYVDSTAWAYENLLRIRPNNYRMWYELGKLDLQLGKIDSAQIAFRNSINIRSDETNIMSYVGLGDIYQGQKQQDSAINILNEALSIDPENILIHRLLTALYIQTDKLDTALVHSRKEVELAPLDRPAARRLGMLYYYLDSLKIADSVFSSLIHNGDRNPIEYRYLGRIALRNEDPEEALQNFSQLVQLEDSSYENWLDLAYAYRLLKQADNELQTYQSGISHMGTENEEGKLRLLFGLAIAYDHYDQFDKAVETFEEVIALSGKYHQALNYLGYLLADRGVRLSYARQLIERALKESPDNPAYLDSYGWVYYRLGEYKKALVQLKKAVELDSDPVIFDHLGDAYQATGDSKEARIWWKKALELDPENKALKEKLGL